MSTRRPTSARADAGRTGAARGAIRRSPGSQSLERGLDILEMIEGEGGTMGVRAIARRLELSPTIVQRMINCWRRAATSRRTARAATTASATARWRWRQRRDDFDYIVTARPN